MIRTTALALGIILLLILTAVGVLRNTSSDDAKTGDKSLDGRWEFVSLIRDGKPVESKDSRPISTIEGESFTVKVGDKVVKATIKVDASQKPKTIDFTPLEGPNKGKTAHGIYEVKSDELRICNAQPGKDRPTEFASKEGSHFSLRIYRRAKH